MKRAALASRDPRERGLYTRAFAARAHPSEGRVREWMTADPVTVGPETPLEEAEFLMGEFRFHHLPVVGQEMKLVPAGNKLEARFRGPNVTPGYWRQPEPTQQAFDEEGYYRIGDAVRFADPTHPEQGLLFDGRLAEDFKPSSGTWASVGPLRARFIAAGAPLVQDVVIAGHDRDFIAVLVFPRLVALVVALPCLTILANFAALGGGIVVSYVYSDISPTAFIDRLRLAIDVSTIAAGLIKAPFMALIIGTIGAVEGLKVKGSAESLGRHVTASVVKSIFLVIVLDALFSIAFARLGV